MHTTIVTPITDFPQFWVTLAGICLLIAGNLAYIGYRRYHNMGGIFLNEIICLWIYKLLKGREKSKEIQKKIFANKKKNKIYGLSAIIGAMGSLLLAIVFVIGAILLTNSK